MELTKGQVVYSRVGRDVQRCYMVAGFEGERVLLCDGGKRPLSAPKRKNIRHVNPTKTVLGETQTDTDANLRAALRAYDEAHGPKRQGATGTPEGG